MEHPTCSYSTMYYTRQLPRADPNICSRTTLQHLNITLVYSFNLKCIIYKSKNKKNNKKERKKKKKKKKEITPEILSLVYSWLDIFS